MTRDYTKTVRQVLIILTAVLMITSVVAPAAGHSLSANTASTTVEEADTGGDGETSDTTSETVTPMDHNTNNSDRVNVTGSLGDGSSAGVKTVFARIHDAGEELPPGGPEGEGVAQTLTDASGNFTLRVPANGTYDIAYWQGDFRTSQNLVPRDGIPDVFAMESITVGESDVSLGDQAPPAGHDLNVSVIDESGNPIEDALVTYVHTENDPDGPVRASLPGLPTNANGLADVSEFNTTARGVAGLEMTGNVTVVVIPPGSNPDRTVGPTRTQPLNVTEDDQITVTLNRTGAPRITDAQAIDREDGDGVVSEGDRVELRATVTDNDSNVDRVFAFPEPFGVERVELTSVEGDLYTGTFLVGSEYSPADGSFGISIIAEDDAGNGIDAFTEPLEVNGSGEGPVGDETPPTITDPTAIDLEDGDGVVSEGDRVELRATVTDTDSNVDRVFAVPEPFGVERVELTSVEGDLYTGTFVVGSDFPVADGDFPIPIIAEDDARNLADVPTNELRLDREPGGPSGFINGTVTDATGAPVPGIELIAVDELTERETFVTTDTDGTYSAAVPVGTFIVIVDAPGFEFESVDGVEVTENDTSVVNVTLEESTPPEITDPTAIDLEDGDGVVSEGDRVELRATVTDNDSNVARVFAFPEPFGFERVELTSVEGDLYTGTFVVGSDLPVTEGEFPIPIIAEDDTGDGVDALTDPLEVNSSGEGPVGDETPPTITDPTAIDLEDGDGVVSNGDLVEIRATVTDDDSGVLQASALPRAFGVGDVELTSASDDVYTGTFRVDVTSAREDGAYRIQIFAEDEAGNDAEAESNTLELDTSGDRVNVTGSLGDGNSAGVKTVFAVVRETDGEFPPRGSFAGETLTDANGNFTLEVLPSETYDIFYYQGDALNERNLLPRDGIPDVFAVEHVAVSDSDVSIGEQSLPTGHDLNVSVVDESGNPIEGAGVGYFHTENDPDDISAIAGLDALPTNADGLADVSNDEIATRSRPGIEVAGNVTVLVIPPDDERFVARTYTRTRTVTEDDRITVTLNETSDTGDMSGLASSVRLTPTSQTVGASGSTTFDVVVEDATGGVGAHTTEISIADPSVAGVTDIELLGNPGQQTVDIAADNGSVTVEAAIMDTADAGPVTVARITVEGNAPGTTAINLGVPALGNETGSDYQVTGVDGASLTVAAVQAIGGFDNAPTDPDGDGFHEDINGNGEVNVVDVQAMFANREDPAMTENPQLFDFSGNDEVDIVDVQALFAEITSPSPDPGEDRLGQEGGYQYDDPVSVDRSDGLNQTELDAVVARSMARVEEVRQLEFEEQVPVNVISRDEFASDRTGREYTTQERLHQNTKWEAMFAVNESTNALRTQESNTAATVLGFYNYVRDEIVIVSENTTSPKMDEITLAQELFHALQDQKLRVSYGRTTTERNNAALGIIEGDGNLVDRFYEQRCEAEWDCLLPESSGGGGGSSDINYGIYLTEFQPYSDGPKFVRQIYNEGGWEAVNTVYENPPESTEQVIHPEKYPDEEPTDVSVTDTSTEEWQILDLGEGSVDHVEFGEAGLSAMMMRPVFASGGEETPVVTPAELYNLTPSGQISDFDPLDYGIEVTNGWDGDRLVPYVNESSAETGETGYVWKINWDSEADATEFVEGYEQLITYYGAETVDGQENTYRIEGNGFADAFYVKQDDDTVTIVNAPAVDDLGDVHASADN